MSEKPTLEELLAPDVDPTWVSQFIIASRLNQVAPRDIADALAEVNDYVHSSGRPAEAVFGPARAYAASLDFSPDPTQDTTHLFGAVYPGICGFLGLTLALWAVVPVRDHQPITLHLGQMISVLVVVALMVVLVFAASAFLRTLLNHTLVPLVLGILTAALVLMPLTLFKQVIGHIPALPLGLAGIVLTLVASLLTWRNRLPSARLEPPAARTSPGAGDRRTAAPHWIGLALAYPLATVVIAAASWFLFP